MCLSDTAEYWQDVNRRTPYMGKDYYHIPNANCGRKHWHEAKAIDISSVQTVIQEVRLKIRHYFGSHKFIDNWNRPRKLSRLIY